MKLEQIKAGKLFKRPDMEEWLILKDDMITYAHRAGRPVLTMKDMTADDWATEVSKEEVILELLEDMHEAIFGEAKNKITESSRQEYLTVYRKIQSKLKQAVVKEEEPVKSTEKKATAIEPEPVSKTLRARVVKR